MAHTIVWSGEALSDIEGIAEFIRRNSIYYAEQVVTSLLETGELLAEQPTRGRIVPEAGSPIIG